MVWLHIHVIPETVTCLCQLTGLMVDSLLLLLLVYGHHWLSDNLNNQLVCQQEAVGEQQAILNMREGKFLFEFSVKGRQLSNLGIP